ncbi:MAG: hypothetical protein M1821_008244 [Bathelium mastoideum]|nr:MAG: hypothetical protein M1821_008244 [Bathelium mastoideum]
MSTSSTSSGLGHYIASGLGGGSSAISSASMTSGLERISNSSLFPTAIRPTSTPRPPSLANSTTSQSVNNSDLACQASSVSVYLAGQAIENNPNNYETQTWYFTDTYEGDISYGTADIYTTSRGFAHAHGNFTVTSTAPFSTTFVRTDLDPEPKSNITYPAEPDCTVGSSVCASLYSSYRSSLGIAPTAPIPYIWPIPTNSPYCYDPESLTAHSTFNYSTLPCDITGNNVQLFYWAPPATGRIDTSVTVKPGIVTTVYNNVTMTSPSIYLSFDTLQANILVTGHENQYIPVGKQYTNPPVVSINPSELSTLTKTISGKDMASVVDEIARGGPDYLSYVSALYLEYFDGGQNNYSAVPVNGADIAIPDPMAYYLGGGWGQNGPPGCNTGFSQPECGTIFDDAYSVQLAVPSEVRNIDPAWASCALPLFGVYDPPHVLVPATAAAAPTPSSIPSVQPPAPGSSILTSLPENTAGPGSVIPATAHAESTATGSLQLPSPAPAPPAPDSDPAETDPNSGSGQHPGSDQGAGGNQGTGGNHEAGGSQEPNGRPASGGSQNISGDENSSGGQGSGGGESSGSESSGSGQHASEMTNPGGSIASIINDQGNSAQGDSGPGSSLGNAGSDPSGHGPTGHSANDHEDTGNGNSDPGGFGTGSTAGQESASLGGVGSDPDDPVVNGQTFAGTQGAQVAEPPIATIAGQAVNLAPSGGIVVGGETYGRGRTAFVGGTPISVGANNLVVGTGASAHSISLATPAAGTDASETAGAAVPAALTPIATVASQVLYANPSDPDEIILPNGQTLSASGPVATVDGSRMSIGPDGKLTIAGSAASQTITLPTRFTPSTTTASGVVFTGTDGAKVTAVATTVNGRLEVLLEKSSSIIATLFGGGAAVTEDGEVVSIGPEGLVVEGEGGKQDRASTILYSAIVTESGNMDTTSTVTTAGASEVSSGAGASSGAPPSATAIASAASRTYEAGAISLILLACCVML